MSSDNGDDTIWAIDQKMMLGTNEVTWNVSRWFGDNYSDTAGPNDDCGIFGSTYPGSWSWNGKTGSIDF
jgi:hypothetical protein